MKTCIVSFLIVTSLHSLTYGQTSEQLYMPLEFKDAYSKGTRKRDGTVSEKYWQNKGHYKIKATIDPFKKLLNGFADITYYNQSPDTLKKIVFHAYNDYYKLGSIRTQPVSIDTDKGIITKGMEVKSLKIASKVVDLKGESVRKEPTLYDINLSTPLPPKSSVSLTIEWETEIPGKGFRRAGASDSTSMFVAYWYPEIAVYDDIDGWDKTVYNAGTEFYHDFNDYEVEITTPNTFIVWASVKAINEKEVLSDKIYSRLSQARLSTKSSQVISAADIGEIRLKSNVWKYKANNFPDFAFALSDHYVWETCLYKDAYGEFVLNSAYDPSHKSFSAVIRNQVAALGIFHSKFPRYKFPFNYFTIFNGESGMEFPGMAHDREITPEEFSKWYNKVTDDFVANMFLSTHEMTHSYFPFLMGINEKKYAWMEEGLASFSSQFIDAGLPEMTDNWPALSNQYLVPMMVPSSLGNLGINSYAVASASYEALYSLLGQEMFLACLNEYMDRWKYKHPTPYDFMKTFNSVSGQDLTWFWKAWYFDWGYLDLGIVQFENGIATIKNEGGRPMGFRLEVTMKDNKEQIYEVRPDVWKNGDKHQIKVDNYTQAKKIQIKSSLLDWVDANVKNDKWEVR